MPRKRGVQSQFKNPGKRKKDGVGRPLTVFPLADIGCPKRGIVVIVSCIFRGPPRGQRRVLGIISPSRTGFSSMQKLSVLERYGVGFFQGFRDLQISNKIFI